MLPEDDVRETPPELFNARAEKVGGFTLDAAATVENAKCDRFYAEDGYWVWKQGATIKSAVCFDPRLTGLTGPWSGRVWINPPFSQIGAWVAKCWRECAAGRVELIEMLLPATRTEQGFWQQLVEPYRDGRPSLVAGCQLTTEFLAGRQHFLKDGKPILNPTTGKRSSPKFGVVILHWERR